VKFEAPGGIPGAAADHHHDPVDQLLDTITELRSGNLSAHKRRDDDTDT